MTLNPQELTLPERLVRDDIIIKSLIDSIPPKYYFDRDVLDQLEDKKLEIGDEDCKGFHHGKKFGIKAKHIRHRLNPFHQKTVSQIIEELEGNQEEENGDENNLSSKGNIEELQQRLRKKIQAMKAERQGSGNKQAQQFKRNVAKLKQKEKRKKKTYPNNNKAFGNTDKSRDTQKDKASPRVFNKEGKLIYSKFDLGTTPQEERKDKSPKPNLKKSIIELKKKEEKIQKLEQESPAKAEEFKNKNLWHQALNKSEGLKVKDNPELLKKSLKRQEQWKRKSQKQWKGRVEQVQKKKQEKQDKRTRNIQSRKKDKLMSKFKRASKKGRLVPGF